MYVRRCAQGLTCEPRQRCSRSARQNGSFETDACMWITLMCNSECVLNERFSALQLENNCCCCCRPVLAFSAVTWCLAFNSTTIAYMFSVRCVCFRFGRSGLPVLLGQHLFAGASAYGLAEHRDTKWRRKVKQNERMLASFEETHGVCSRQAGYRNAFNAPPEKVLHNFAAAGSTRNHT